MTGDTNAAGNPGLEVGSSPLAASADAPVTDAPVSDSGVAAVDVPAPVEVPAASVEPQALDHGATDHPGTTDHALPEPVAPSETTAVVSSDPGSIGVAAMAPPSQASPTSDGETPAPVKRKIELNPAVGPEHLRAIPTYGTPSTPQMQVMSAGTEPAPLPPDMAPYLQAPSGPVAVPSEIVALDADLEAQVAAAMSGAMSSEPAAPGSSGGEAHATPVAPGIVTPASEDDLVPGAKLKAKVQSVSADSVFCEIGFRSPGLVPIKQFPVGKPPNVGEEFLVVIDQYDAENGVVMVSLPRSTRRPRGNWEDLAVGQVVECFVNKTNKGGLEVTVSHLRAFLPASQVDLGFVSSLEPYVGQKFAVQITEVNPAKKNLVVSRKVLLVQERKEAAATFWQAVEVGQQFRGTVKSIKDYGAFIDLGGADGFLHVGEMSWTRIKSPADILQEGQAVDVVVLSLDREKHKVSLGMRQLAQNPWNTAVDKYPVGRPVNGKVTRVTDFGAFLELEAGVEGLVHISELDHKRIKKVTDVLTVGQEVSVQVLEVAPDRQRISLSLKALKEKPEEPKEEDLAPGKGQLYERKRREPLRGGTGLPGSTGGLFGNPTDFQG
jgi:predicted RNA-binding protein with RPS1 domain